MIRDTAPHAWLRDGAFWLQPRRYRTTPVHGILLPCPEKHSPSVDLRWSNAADADRMITQHCGNCSSCSYPLSRMG